MDEQQTGLFAARSAELHPCYALIHVASDINRR